MQDVPTVTERALDRTPDRAANDPSRVSGRGGGARRAWTLVGLAAGCAALLLGASLALPHDRYLRFQAFNIEAYQRLRWIYERVHFDPTPVDVAFLGTSRTMNGVDPGAVARAAAASGRCLAVTNLAVPAYGRNMHWLVARELLENRRVGTLVIEVFENESRRPHAHFAQVADVSDVLGAPVLVNIRWLADLSLLPLRQVTLWLKSLWPEQFGLHRRFDPARYDGPAPDATRRVRIGGVDYTRLRDGIADPAGLERAAEQTRRDKNLNMLGPWLSDLEFRFPRHYLDLILDLAREKGVEVRFAYLPAYGQPVAPVDTALYDGRGPIMTVNDLLADRNNWHDFHHVNLMGAAAVSARLGVALANARAAPRGVGEPACEAAAVPDTSSAGG